MKNKIILIVVSVILIGAGFFVWQKFKCDSSYCHTWNIEKQFTVNSIQLSAYSGINVPFTVTVTGPAELIAKKNNVWNGFEGCQYNIDWGDGITATEGDGYCTRNLTHTYKFAGIYKVKANTFHANPNDSLATDWSGITQVHIDKPGRSEVISDLEIDLSLGGDFQTTKYQIKNSKLIYFHSDEKGSQNSTTTVTSVDLDNIDYLLTQYKLENLHSDPPPGPDMLNYYMQIVKDGRTYKLQFVTSQNPGYLLAQALEELFNQMRL